MHFATTLSILATTASMASAVKVQYYSDGGCSNYLVEFHPPGDTSCYNYEYSNQHSANVAGCDGAYDCVCTFYDKRNCKGKTWKAYHSSRNDNCASNWNGGGHKSMKCVTVDQLGLPPVPIPGGRA